MFSAVQQPKEVIFTSKIISVITQKGGVGKTTTVNALAATFTRCNYRVLAIDLDPQGNLSFSTGAESENSPTIYEVVRGDVKLTDAIQRMSMTDIVPSNILLSGIELEYTGKNREYLLYSALKEVSGFYDFILIDSPPGLGILTVNALTACDYVIIPMMPDIFSLQGLTLVYETIEYVKKSVNPKIEIAGVLINRYVKRSKLHKEVYGTAQMICQKLSIPLFETVIRNSCSLAEAQSLQMDITDYAKRSTGAKDFKNLVLELERSGIARHPYEGGGK